MRFRVFQYPLPTGGELGDLNSFLGSQRIATVAHHVAATPHGAMLIFVVEVADGPAHRGQSGEKAKIDYRETLSPDQFALFTRLRAARKEWADAEGLPVYALFTNAQLARIAAGSFATAADLARIEGLGPARVERYAERLLSIVNPLPFAEPAPSAAGSDADRSPGAVAP